jgi:hypothetical protein
MNPEQLARFKEMFPHASQETLTRMEASPTTQTIGDIFASISKKEVNDIVNEVFKK